ncbi:mitogen-activated protein kinase kinase kinase [Trifolium repens]|nr:mitogen-activated protein kinase kinase kinase [Trifolium repens]WJX40864.1 mitogen-activated protein kinase kinase kinase [Trifolium repens]
MPTWWGKKSTKSKDLESRGGGSSSSGGGGGSSSSGGGVLHFNFNKSPIRNGYYKPENPNDGLNFRNSPRSSRDFTPSSDSIGHPLPRPSFSSTQSFSNDQGNTITFGSASVSGGSSISSNASSDDPSTSNSQINTARGQCETKFNGRPKSPGPGLRGPTSPTSPLHARLHVLSLDSPTGKQEDGRSECHPLPLPPGSPTSPSFPNNTRSNVLLENSTASRGRWKKGKLLGRGTFGHVYLGFNSESGQLCAIKEVRAVGDDQTSKECLKQLNQEIDLLSQLSHPNIVQYHGSDMGEETLSVYLEYVSGGSIHKLLQEYGSFKEPVIQNYSRQILSGLSYLHSRNTVHRDIKGANILVDPNGVIKLADFGMAKHINSSSSMLSFKGSPHWMAPEVVMNTNGYSLPVDIWSLGCTILEMATSKPPWSQYEGVAAIFKIGNSKDMPEIPDHLSNDAKNFIKLCLHRDPSTRPTAQMLLNHPFIRDQSATKAANVRITRDAFPCMFDGSRTPPASDLHSSRTCIASQDADYATKTVVAASRTPRSPRDNTRTITSLPVSPCSSPLRQYGAAHKSGFLSPPHPSYTMMGQKPLVSYESYPMRSNTKFTLDPWHETSMYKAHTPGGSPRRLI